jgi:hypothetical protein
VLARRWVVIGDAAVAVQPALELDYGNEPLAADLQVAADRQLLLQISSLLQGTMHW